MTAGNKMLDPIQRWSRSRQIRHVSKSKAPQSCCKPERSLVKGVHGLAKRVSSRPRSYSFGVSSRKLCAGASRATMNKEPCKYHGSAKLTRFRQSPASPLILNGINPGTVLPPNRFVFDINVHIPNGTTGTPIGKVSKRVLLDTGADLNLISFPAFRDVRTPMATSSVCLQSLAGQTAIDGEIRLSFNFLSSHAAKSHLQNAYCEDFAVISDGERPLFDCILGSQWIFAHWEEVSALMASRI